MIKWLQQIVIIISAISILSKAYSDFSPAVIARLDQAFEQAFASSNLVGLTAGVWVGEDSTWVRTKGEGNIPANRPLFYSDVMRIASITKTFTTTVILQLVDKGLLSLDESIERFNLGVPNANNITVRELCNHTSGLFDYVDDPTFQVEFFAAPWRVWTPQALVALAVSHPPLFPPGTQVKYNNTGFILQSMIIEQLTGVSINRAIELGVILPLRLENTSLPISPFLFGEFARGYLINDSEVIDFTVLNPSSSQGAGGLISSLRDLKTWAKALAKGDLISPEMQAERLIRVAPPAAPGPFQGPYLRFGLGIEQLGDFTLDADNVFLGHDGEGISYNCSMNYLISQDAAFVIMLNKNSTQFFPSDEANTLFMALAKILFPANSPWPYPY